MKILITGINGFVGTNFTNNWFRRSHTIYGMDILVTVTENAVLKLKMKNGRNAISWQQKFAFDVWYVDNVSLSLDIKILLKTIQKVFKREGISSDICVTMEAFKGN